jgi:hypothetical protein
MDGYEKLVCVDISVKMTNATGTSAIFKCAIKSCDLRNAHANRYDDSIIGSFSRLSDYKSNARCM